MCVYVFEWMCTYDGTTQFVMRASIAFALRKLCARHRGGESEILYTNFAPYVVVVPESVMYASLRVQNIQNVCGCVV